MVNFFCPAGCETRRDQAGLTAPEKFGATSVISRLAVFNPILSRAHSGKPLTTDQRDSTDMENRKGSIAPGQSPRYQAVLDGFDRLSRGASVAHTKFSHQSRDAPAECRDRLYRGGVVVYGVIGHAAWPLNKGVCRETL